MRNRMLLGLVMYGVGIASSAFAQDTGKVTSFHGKSPTASEITKGFLGDTAAPAGGQDVVGKGVMPSTVPTGPSLEVTPAAVDGPPAPVAPGPGTPPAASCPAKSNSVAVEVTFGLDSAALDARAHQTLQAVAEAMQAMELSGCRFVVEGHTDASGSDAYNQALSEKRAAAVRDFLIERSIGVNRLVAVGMGENSPLNAADPVAAENRRVQFRIQY